MAELLTELPKDKYFVFKYMRHVNTSIQTCTQMVFSEDKVQQICRWLSFLNIESKKARQQHVQNVKAIKKGKLFD